MAKSAISKKAGARPSKAVKSPTLSLFHRSPSTSEDELRSAFQNKNQWVMTSFQSLADWYSVILSNLTCRFFIPESANIDFVRSEIEKGLEKPAFDRLKFLIGTSSDDLAKVIRIPSRTLARRSTFKPEETERLLRVTAAFQRTIEMTEDLTKARRWFTSPKRALGNQTPLNFCDTEPGANEVLNLLGRIDHGVFS